MTLERAPAGFDPDFDDAAWSEDWLGVPITQPPPATHPSGYRIVAHLVDRAEVFGRTYRLSPPQDCRVLLDPAGRVWMSSTPQEHMMMHNNARRSRGHVLVGGLGLGLYPQYAAAGVAGDARRFTVVEQSPVVRELVEPTLLRALSFPLTVVTGDVAAHLAGPPRVRYDTVFLDTWDTLDAANLPEINRLRDLALRHLAPGGRLLLWGYGWMLRLFADACRELLAVEPARRAAWLLARARTSPQAAALLAPVAQQFAGQALDDAPGLAAALAWCRRHIVAQTTPPTSAAVEQG